MYKPERFCRIMRWDDTRRNLIGCRNTDLRTMYLLSAKWQHTWGPTCASLHIHADKVRVCRSCAKEYCGPDKTTWLWTDSGMTIAAQLSYSRKRFANVVCPTCTRLPKARKTNRWTVDNRFDVIRVVRRRAH